MSTQHNSCALRTGPALLALAAGAAVVLAPAVASAAPGTGGCQDFGARVSGNAQSMGGDFGAFAAGQARELAPGQFATVIVQGTQDADCP